jgi:hypothetical protein
VNNNYPASSFGLSQEFLSFKSLKSKTRFHIFILLISIFSILSFSCTSRHYRDFDLVDQNYKLNPDSIVVLPGSLREQDLLLAAAVSEYLKKNSSFDVVSFDQVEINIPNYRHIVGDLKVNNLKKNKSTVHYLSKHDIGQVNAINIKFKAKYVFLVWSGDLVNVLARSMYTASSNVDFNVKIFSQLIEYPNSKVVGYTFNSYSASESKGFLSFLNITKWFRSDNEKVVDLLKKSGLIIGEEIVRVSNQSGRI